MTVVPGWPALEGGHHTPGTWSGPALQVGTLPLPHGSVMGTVPLPSAGPGANDLPTLTNLPSKHLASQTCPGTLVLAQDSRLLSLHPHDLHTSLLPLTGLFF